MSNTIKIKPFQVWTSNGLSNIDCLAISNFFDYNFDNCGGKIEYKLIITDDENGATEFIKDTLEIPSEIVQQWGEDDSIIFDYVINKLGLERNE